MTIHDATEVAYKNGYARAIDDIRVNDCPKCGSEYNQEFKSYHIRRHGGIESVQAVSTKFCPECGRMLIRQEEVHG